MQSLCGSSSGDATAQRALLSTLGQLCDSLEELIIAVH
jgi:hypothetical protein